MNNRQEVVRLLSEQADHIRRQFAVKNITLFGPIEDSEAIKSSDAHILVEFDGLATFDNFMDLKFFLEDLLSISVDLVTNNAVKPLLRLSLEGKRVVVRETHLYVQNLLTACEKIQRYTAGLTRDEFLQDELTRDAVMRNMLIISQEANRVPDTIRLLRNYPTRARIGGMRGFVVHDYFGIDDDTLWYLLTNSIPELYEAVVEIRDEL